VLLDFLCSYVTSLPCWPRTELSTEVCVFCCARALACCRLNVRQGDGKLSPQAFDAAPKAKACTMAHSLPAAPDAAAPHVELVLAEQLPAGQLPEEGHLAHDADGAPLLCLLSHAAGHLTAVRLPQPGQHDARVAFTLPGVVSAAAVVATRDAAARPEERLLLRDLLVLRANGSLALYVGQGMAFSVAARAEDSKSAQQGGAATASPPAGGRDLSEVSTTEMQYSPQAGAPATLVLSPYAPPHDRC
jgi:hypothetical protein